jgi:general secretion pathway protein G
MKNNLRHGKAAFTLIELMAVITIIVILAGLVVGGLGFVTEKQAKNKATLQIALLSKGLEAYKMDMGAYPLTLNSSDGLNNSAESLYIPLFYEGYAYSLEDTPPDKWSKPVGGVEIPKSMTIYITDLDPTTTKQGWVDPVLVQNSVPPTTTKVKDPWGIEYRYRSAQSQTGTATNQDTQNPDFDLWTSGKDSRSNTTPVHKDNRDDIKNF